MTKTLLLVSSLLMTACASGMPQREVQATAFDGAWTLYDVQCPQSDMTKVGDRGREDLKNGAWHMLLTLTGDQADIFMLRNANAKYRETHPNARCEVRAREKWEFDTANHRVKVSKTVGTSYPVDSEGVDCPSGEWDAPKPRLHDLEVKAGLLRLTAAEVVQVSSAAPEKYCQRGPITFVYKRVF